MKGQFMNIFQEFIKNKTPTYKEVDFWSYENDTIHFHGSPLNIHMYDNIFKPIALWFREWQKMANLETQVLVVTKEDYNNYYKQFPLLPTDDDRLRVVILPQYNTPSNTIIDDSYWHKTIKGEPIMRIHSHHILNAYQSQTDFNSLNSGILEVVFGKVDTDTIEIAYWLTRHSDITTKEHVFYTTLTINK